MKKIYLFVILLFPFLGFGQTIVNSSDIPKNVRHKIHTLYPHIKEYTWIQNDGYYLVKFNNEGQEKKVIISENGVISEGITLDLLPKTIREKLYKMFPNENITIYKVKSKEYGEIFKIISANKTYFIDKTGKIILSLCGK